MNEALLGVMGTVIAALIAAIVAPRVKRRIEREAEAEAAARQKELDDAANEEADKATIATLVNHQVDRLFQETDRLRAAYREDLADLRRQLMEANERQRTTDRQVIEANRRQAEAESRIRVLEQEVAEWRSGMHGVPGVWVAVPAHVWTFVREHLPELPSTRFPGERPHIDATTAPQEDQ